LIIDYSKTFVTIRERKKERKKRWVNKWINGEWWIKYSQTLIENLKIGSDEHERSKTKKEVKWSPFICPTNFCVVLFMVDNRVRNRKEYEWNNLVRLFSPKL